MPRWRVRLGHVAERDFSGILAYTADHFGVRQAKVYKTTLSRAISALHLGPNVLGSVARDDVGPRLRSLHVARMGRRGSHLILYRTKSDDIIEVLRILHDSMDAARHVPRDLK
jgi:toxin ParE1/3/4